MKGVLFLISVCSISTTLQAQAIRRAGEVYLGMSIGINYSQIDATAKAPTNITELSTTNGLGYRLGLLGGMQLSRHLAADIKPSLVFNDSRLGLTRSNLQQEAYGQSVMVECAAHIIYKCYTGKTIPFFLGGASYRQPLSDATSTIKQMVRPTVAADIGIGIEKRFNHFSVAPEIRYSRGLSNLQHINGINSVKMHSVVFSLNFKN